MKIQDRCKLLVSMLRRRLKVKITNNKMVREKYAKAEQCLLDICEV